MSDIFNKDLINQLLKHGLDFEHKFTKGGQAAAAQVNANAALKQLLDNLESQLYPQQKDPNAPAEVSTDSDSAVSLTSTALEGLGSLVAFLAQNKISVDGQRVAYYQQEDPKSEDYQLYRLEPNAGFLEPATRETVTNGFFVNKDLLVKYITTLQAGLAKKPNDVLRVQLGALVNQSNKLLGTQLGTTYQAPEATLADGQVLDSFPQVIDPKNYGADGNAALTFGDIKSPEAFNAWMQSHSISVGGKTMKDQDFDRCVVIQTVHSKAKWKASTATNDTLKNRNAIYLKQVEKIGPSITGPDGKACTLAGVSTSPAAGAGGATADSLSRLVSALPLAAGDIDFSRIRTFFDAYRQMVNPSRPGAAAALRAMDNVVNTAMPNAQKMTENQMDSYPLSVDATTLATWLIPPKGMAQANSLINNLRYVVAETAAVVRDLKNAYQAQLKQYPQLEAAVIGQIGEDAESAGFAGVNLNHLDLWSKSIAAQPQNSPGATPPGWKARGY
jgi:hypothetical protein